MPRKTRSPATETVSFKVTVAEKRGLQRLLRQNKDRVQKLTGRTNLSGLLRLMVSDAVGPLPKGLFVGQYAPVRGQWLNVSAIEGVELLDKLRELFQLRDEDQSHEDFWAENFPDWDPKVNPFSD